MFGKNKRLSLEITPERFRAVQLQVSDGSCTVIRALDVERSANSRDADRPNAGADELRELLCSNGMKTTDVRVVFDSGPVSITTISVARSALDDISERAQWYSEQHSPIPVHEAVVNFRICDATDEDPVPVVLVATEKRKIEKVLAVLSNAKIKVRKMDIVPFALERLFLDQADDIGGKTVALIGLRERNVCVAVQRDGRAEFFRYFRIFENMAMQTLVERLKHTLQAYADWHPLSRIGKVYFYRLAEVFSQLENTIQRHTGIQVVPVDPMKNIGFADDDMRSGLDLSRLNSIAPLIGAAL